jgi:TetR/AcrR family transcriptional regulator, fatty acid metabolism regulator protein
MARVELEQDRSRARRQRILEAGMQVFARKGYRDTAVDEIAAESDTSKGGVYFHFPNKQAIFLALLERMGNLLIERIEAAMMAAPDPVARGDAALLTVLRTFGSHRALTRLFLVEAMGAGREFNDAIMALHARCAALITRHLDDAVAQGMIAPLNTDLAGVAWFGALNEVAIRWVLTGSPARLEDAYPALRDLLTRGVGLAAAPEPDADNGPRGRT